MIRNILITAYVLFILSLSATARADNQLMPIFIDLEQVQTQVYTGEIAVTPAGESFLVLEDGKFFKLAANIDLVEFNGMVVEIDGLEIKHKVGPVYELASMDPLPGFQRETRVSPVLIVFGIREITK